MDNTPNIGDRSSQMSAPSSAKDEVATEQPVPVASPADVLLYATRRSLYGDYSQVIAAILRQALERDQVRFLDVQCRAKTVESFEDKASRLDDAGRALKYARPLEELTDLAACRVIVFFPRTLSEVESAIQREFTVVEKVDHAALAIDQGRLGYLSVHYICKLKLPRSSLPEYQRFSSVPVEIQVRTVMQHAWAEIEHDIQYKSQYSVPKELGRRFTTLAGLLEVADHEFQNIQDRDRELRSQARTSINLGQLDKIELTAASLKEYLDKTLGPDKRMTSWSYDFGAKLARQLGYLSIGDIEQVITRYDDDLVSRTLSGSRQGQLNRFEFILLAANPGEFRNKHPYAPPYGDSKWFHQWVDHAVEALKLAGIPPLPTKLSQVPGAKAPGSAVDGD